VDEQVLEIVAAGDTAEATDMDAAVELALASDADEQAKSDDDAASGPDEQAESDNDTAGDEETSD
jgi:hypothetical protein